MTSVDLKPFLNSDEYTNFKNFLHTHVDYTSTKMQYVDRIDRHSKRLYMAVNDYEIDDIVRVAKKRLVKPRVSGLTKRTLNRVLHIIKGIA